MSQQLRFGSGPDCELVTQNLGNATVQNLAPALKQILVGRILNKSVLEAILAFGSTPSTSTMSASESFSRATSSGASSMSATAFKSS